MTKLYFCLLSFFLCFSLFAQQTVDFGSADSHEFYVKQLTNAKDQNFDEIVAKYDAYIAEHPANVVAQVERCKFIGNSYYDEYEDYNLKWEETDQCLEALVAIYPNNAKVLLYQALNSYGESQLEVLENAIKLIDTDDSRWLSDEKATIYELMGDYYSEEHWQALRYYKKAQQLNDSLDLSLDIATIYESQGRVELAKNTLLPKLEKDTNLWKMNQKATLLLKLEEPEQALHLFDVIRGRDSTYIDNEEMAQAMLGLEDYTTARIFLVKDTIKEWGKLNAKQALFKFDLEHSDSNIALVTYRSLQKESSYDDFFGVKRLKIAVKNPLLPWSFTEFMHLLLLLILVLALFIVPYLWVLPIYGLGELLKKKSLKIHQKVHLSWGISHFWLVSFFYLLVQMVVIFVFEYETTLNYYFDLGNSYVEETIDQKTIANSMIVFVGLMAISTLFVIRNKGIRDVFKSNLSIRQMIGLSILFVVFNRIIIKLLGLFVEIETPVIDPSIFLTVQEEILAVISQNGFFITALLVAVIVPIYEEIIFRGVILGSVEKYIGFNGANIIQAILFALVHDNLSLFPFFFIFAMVTGYWVKKSGGLLTGIFFHGVHNLTITVALYYLSRLATFTP